MLATGLKSKADKLFERFDEESIKKYLSATGKREGFVGFDLSQQPVLDIEDLRAHHDREYEKLRHVDEHGNFMDVDQDGFFKATFSICKADTQNPGYSVNVPRIQHGCVYPDNSTGISTKFDAAFVPVSNYLNNQPKKPILDENGYPVIINNDVQYEEMTEQQKLERMKENAVKYKNKIQEFGLCIPSKLNEKFQIPEKIRRCLLKAPNGLSANDYNDTKLAAEAISVACMS